MALSPDKCACLKQETTEHFLILCPMYKKQRKKCFKKLHCCFLSFLNLQLRKKFKLCCQVFFQIPDFRNIKIVFIVQNYILQTRRFASPPPYPLIVVVPTLQCTMTIVAPLHLSSSYHITIIRLSCCLFAKFFYILCSLLCLFFIQLLRTSSDYTLLYCSINLVSLEANNLAKGPR